MCGKGIAELLAPGNAISEEISPLSSHFLVKAVEDEDEGSLQRGDDGEEDQEDSDHNVVGDKEHKISKHPRKTNGHVDGDIHSKFLLSVSLVALWSSCQGLVNFTSNKEEEDSVRGDDQESRDEESHEASQIVGDPTLFRSWCS